MPTYDYKCKSCGHKFEYLQNITAEPLANCPECGGTLHRLIGAGAGLIFKGSGFYITDYRKDKSDYNRQKSSKEEKGSGEKKEKKESKKEKSSTTKEQGD